MNGIVSTALSGLQAATTRIGAAANNIANVQTTGTRDKGDESQAYTPQDVVQISQENGGVQAKIQERDPATVPISETEEAPNIDLAEEIVGMKQAEHAYKAALSVIKTSQEMDDALNEIV